MNALMLVMLTKKFASRLVKEGRFFLTGVDWLSVLSISGDKGIIYQCINHAELQKTYGCCLKMIFCKHFIDKGDNKLSSRGLKSFFNYTIL